MRDYIIEMLGGVPSEVYDDAENGRVHYYTTYHQMSDKAAKLEQTLNEKISEIGQLQELLRVSKAAVERVENERANCSEGWTKANELVTEVIAERDILARKIINMPQRKFKLDASVVPRKITQLGKVVSYELYLTFTPETGVPAAIVVRTLAASKKSKDELDKVALQINSTVDGFVNL